MSSQRDEALQEARNHPSHKAGYPVYIYWVYDGRRSHYEVSAQIPEDVNECEVMLASGFVQDWRRYP